MVLKWVLKSFQGDREVLGQVKDWKEMSGGRLVQMAPKIGCAYLHRCVLVSVTRDKKDGHGTCSKDTNQICLTHPQARNDLKIPVGLCAQSRLTLCDRTDCSRLCSPVHRILQARILEWVANPLSRGSSRLTDQTCISCVSFRLILYHWSHLVSPKNL